MWSSLHQFEPMVWYVAFYPRRRDLWSLLGHCDMWGATRDDNWVFIDPARRGMQVQVVHKAEEVELLMTLRLGEAESVLRLEQHQIDRRWTIPLIAPATCASVCGATLGLRAWTPAALRRKMLAIGAQEVEAHADPRREQGSEAGTEAGVAHGTP